MTFSILAFDEKTGIYGGAAATGSLCVGGWVLRGDPASGLSASQGTSPSTLWGEDVLRRMRAGASAAEAVAAVTGADPGRGYRQLSALAPGGGVAAFTGDASVPVASSITGGSVVVAGNMLDNDAVLPAILEAFGAADGAMPDRLQAALKAGQRAGGDSRGLLSAALLVVARDAAPLSLRVDWSDDPLADLARLSAKAHSDPYHMWTRKVPTLDAPYRDGADAEDAGEPAVIRR
jgi:uncharacterized Ntn-hydrolase superfamily protein